VDNVEPFERELQRVGLVELERVARHRPNVYTDDIEPSPGIPSRRTTGATEQVQETRLRHDALPW
jgi:hypothetical protein